MLNASRQNDPSDRTYARLVKLTEEAEARFNAKKEELNTLVYRLVDREFWPVPPQNPDDPKHAITEEKYREVRVIVWELRDKVRDLSDRMQKQLAIGGTSVAGSTTPTPAPMPTIPRTIPPASSDAMVVDEPRPPKRRRLSNSEQTEDRPAPRISSRAMEAVQERLTSIEGKIGEIENDLVQFDQDLQAHLDERIDEKLSSLNLPPMPSSPAHHDNATFVDTGQVSTEVAQRLEQFKADFEKADQDIEEVAKSLAEVITNQNMATHEAQLLRAENEAMKAQIATVSTYIDLLAEGAS